jgi:hypothetical protein
MRKYLILLLLAGCTPHMLYHPNLSGEPTEQYYSDLDSCKKEWYSNYAHNLGQSLVEPGALWQRPEAYNQIDNCLRKKGYAIN